MLNQHAQAGTPLDRWAPRSRLGMYVGPSPTHSSTVHLILNPTKGHVSPQWHVLCHFLFVRKAFRIVVLRTAYHTPRFEVSFYNGGAYQHSAGAGAACVCPVCIIGESSA